MDLEQQTAECDAPVYRGITSVQLKWIAIVTMMIDHIGASLIEWKMVYTRTTDPELYAVLRQVDFVIRRIGRIAFPLFIFLLIEGFFYTRSRRKYFGRMLLFALLSEFPFDLAFFLRPSEIHKNVWWRLDHQNVFFTLAIGFLVIWIMETLRPKEWKGFTWDLIPRVLLAAASVWAGIRLAKWMHTDYSWAGVSAISLGYLIRLTGHRELELFGILGPLIKLNSMESIAVLDFALTSRYFGFKGESRMSKWFFYLFYPVHLLIYGVIRLLFILPL